MKRIQNKDKQRYSSMAAAFLLFLLLLVFHTAEAQQRYSNISLGSSLTPNTDSPWLSPSRIYAFGFVKQVNGFAVGIFLAGMPEKTVVWTANRDDNPTVPSNVTLLLTADGRLILQPSQGQDIDIATPVEPIASASMLDTGNFVLYNRNQKIIWQSFDHPTDTLLPGQRLTAGQELFSRASETDYSKGIFRLKMQDDGNLVQYPVETPDTAPYSYWSSGTYGVGNNVTLNLDDDGHLYLLNVTLNIKNITDGGYPKQRTIYIMRIDVDGILRLFSHSLDKGNWSTIWSSTNDRCAPKGLCGLNGFCTPLDQEIDCQCLPGFDFVSPGIRRSGCERNFTAESCKAKNATLRYIMRRADNTIWEDVSYAVLETITLEDCQAACEGDCNCEAAFFKDQQCRKQRLPLKFGRRFMSDSNIALIKVGIPESSANAVPTYVSREKKKELRVDVLIISISLVVFAFLVLAISGIVVRRTRSWAYKKINEIRNVELIDDVAPRAFTYAELVQATNDFKEELGKGAFGTVYKGILPDSQKVVAVKRLEKVLEEGEREFQTEMKVIGKTHHRNLVRLLGYCLDGPKRLLVYAFMSSGSLADILFTQENRLSWEERTEIAVDIARGILYLHEECETQIIHCDIKPQNILMDEKMCAKISDFGLAKLLKQDQTKTYTGIRGTRGYVAPEWHRRLPVTIKADVYSFGIVLLEIICHRKCVDWSLPEFEAVLEEWVYECFQAGELGKLVCDEAIDKKKLERLVKVGIWCIQDEPSLRPSMKKVLLMIEGTVDIPVPPSPISFFSAV